MCTLNGYLQSGACKLELTHQSGLSSPPIYVINDIITHAHLDSRPHALSSDWPPLLSVVLTAVDSLSSPGGSTKTWRIENFAAAAVVANPLTSST